MGLISGSDRERHDHLFFARQAMQHLPFLKLVVGRGRSGFDIGDTKCITAEQVGFLLSEPSAGQVPVPPFAKNGYRAVVGIHEAEKSRPFLGRSNLLFHKFDEVFGK